MVISTLIGVLSSAVPHALSFFADLRKERAQAQADARDKAHELEIMKLQLQAANLKLEEIRINADRDIQVARLSGPSSAHALEAPSSGPSFACSPDAPSGLVWVNAVRSLVQPVISLLVTLLFSLVVLGLIEQGLRDGSDLITMSHSFIDIGILDNFGAIVGFYFGGQAFDRIRSGYKR